MKNDPSRLALDELLAPMKTEEFLADYWGKRPLFLKGHAQKFERFYDRAALDRALRMQSASGEAAKIRATFDAVVMRKPWFVPQFPIQPGAVRDAYAAGATVCVTSLHHNDPKLARFVDSIRAELGYPGHALCNAYLSPNGSGFGMHFDARIASTLQLEGSKWWTFATSPAVHWPPTNALYDEGKALYLGADLGAPDDVSWAEAREQTEGDFTEVLLEPGDLLVLPAGTWHKARAEGHSLAINLAFDPADVTALIADILRREFEHRPEWRSLLPGRPGTSTVGAADEHLAARLAEAAEFLRSLRPDAESVRHAVGGQVMTRTPVKKSAPAAAERRPLTREDTVRIPPDSAVYWQDVGGGEELALYVDDQFIQVEGDSRTFLAEIIARRSFVAGESASWSSPPRARADVCPVLEELLESGILEMA